MPIEDDVFFVDPNPDAPFKELVAAFDAIPKFAAEHTKEELDELGKILSKALEGNTPKNTGYLARSTKFEVSPLQGRNSAGQYTSLIEWELQITQSAMSKPERGKPYHYMYTVHHGIQPLGRLRAPDKRPPYENLVPWAVKRFGVDKKTGRVKAGAVAKKIAEQGIKPNDYIKDTLQQNEGRIQQTADIIGRSIIADLTRLPNMERE